MSDINLTGGTQRALLGLTNSTRQVERADEQLSTNRRVNRPTDDAVAFFSARALTDAAEANDTRVRQIEVNQSSLATAAVGANAVDGLVSQQRGLLAAARTTNDPEQLAQISRQINELSTQITNIANDTSFQGQNLVNSAAPQAQVTQFSDDPASRLTVAGQDLTAGATGLNLPTLATDGSDIDSAAEIDALDAQLAGAQATTRAAAATIGSNAALLSIREDFTRAVANIQEEGAASQTEADLNEAGARAVAGRAAQTIGVNALALSAQFENSVARLFDPR